MIKRELIDIHINIQCSNTLLKCDECKLDVLSKDTKYHINELCQEHHISCKHCKKLFKRKTMNEHENICPEKIIKCSLQCSLVICVFKIAKKKIYIKICI